MMLRRFALTSTPTAHTGAVLALLALAGVGIAAANMEAVVASRFAAALEAPPQHMTVATAASRAVVAGSEAYWLAERQRHESDGASVEPAAWSAPVAADLAVGDRFTVPGGKSDRVLQVIAIAGVEPAPGTLQARAAPPVREIAITCRDLSDPDGQLVTFVLPAETAPAALRSAHAL